MGRAGAEAGVDPGEELDDEAHIQAEESQALEQARLPSADAHPRGACDPQSPPSPRPPGTGRPDGLEVRPLTTFLSGEHERLPRAARLRRGSDIRRVLRSRIRRRTRALDVYIGFPAGDAEEPSGGRSLPRVGWVVPKYGQRSVARNRLKRRLREIARRRVLVGLRAAGSDAEIVVRVRRAAYRATYRDLEAQWTGAIERSRLPAGG